MSTEAPLARVSASLNGGQSSVATHRPHAPANVNGDQSASAVQSPPVPADALLNIYADLVDDLESMRKATENRKRSLIQVKGLEGSPEEKRLGEMVDALKKIENAAVRDLSRHMAAHPLGPFAEENFGIGYKSLARLLAAIGDPCSYVDQKTGEVIDRTVSKLWAYCGLHTVDGLRPRRKKGQQANWNSKAKSLVWVAARACIYQKESPYRSVYEAARQKADEKVHQSQCQNTIRPVAGKPMGSNGCGTQKNPELGAPGSPWRDGHKDAYATAIVGKQILKDLWKFRRDQVPVNAQGDDVPPNDLDRGHRAFDAHPTTASANGNGAA